jgi:DNA end-binding protein Ku
LSNREHLGAIKARDELIVLNQLRFSKEIRGTEELKVPSATVVRKEIDLAISLIQQLSGPFEPEKYRDNYLDELTRLIEEKIKGVVPSKVSPQPERIAARDLMGLLRSSLEMEKRKDTAKAS